MAMHLIEKYRKRVEESRARELAKAAAVAKLYAARPPRPKLSLETVPEYLEWVLNSRTNLFQGEMENHMRACEMLVRLKMGEAQAKDTQHTLVRDGVIDPPPPAPGGGQSV